MKQNHYFLNTALAVVLGIACTAAVLVRCFTPAALIPHLDIPNMVALSLVALLIDHYVARDAKRCYICIPVFAVLTFGLLPFAASFVGIMEALKLALAGGIVFTITTWLFTTIQERLSTGPAAKAAAFFSAVSLYMAAQCFMGILL